MSGLELLAGARGLGHDELAGALVVITYAVEHAVVRVAKRRAVRSTLRELGLQLPRRRRGALGWALRARLIEKGASDTAEALDTFGALRKADGTIGGGSAEKRHLNAFGPIGLAVLVLALELVFKLLALEEEHTATWKLQSVVEKHVTQGQHIVHRVKA